MKKNVFIIFCLSILYLLPAQAGIKWGIKAGANLSEPSFSLNTLQTDNFTGFQAGPIIEFKLPIIGLGMDAAVLYSLQGFKIDEQTQKTSTLELPLNIKYKIGLGGVLGIYGSAGAYASFKLGQNDFFINEVSDQFKSQTFGAGLNFGFGIELFSHLQVGANYQLGMTDDYSSKEYSVKSKVWSLSAAYFF